MVLKPQDLLLALKLWVGQGQSWTYQSLAQSLGMSAAEVHAAAKRACLASFLRADNPLSVVPNAVALHEFVVHGARYAFPGQLGGMSRGIPTAYAASPLNLEILPSDEPMPVWPHPKGTVRGLALEPIFTSVPVAAMNDPALYELLALLDALRIGRVRERQLAARLIGERIK